MDCSQAVPVKSTHKAEVVSVVLEAHPDADALSVVRVFGYTCVVRSEDWRGVDRGVYVVPDSVVDVRRPEFAFLAPQARADMTSRVKARRLRGVVSYGLLVPAPAGAALGDDLAGPLGVTRYEPPEPHEKRQKFLVGGEEEDGPGLETGPDLYDVDSFERYAAQVFTPGEPVLVTEKLDGSNVRFVYHDDRFWVKSRKRWVKRTPDYSHVTVEGLTSQGMPPEKAASVVDGLRARQPQVNGFWGVLERTPGLPAFLRAHPDTVVYGEVYGGVNRIKYGLPEGNRFAAFDVYRGGRFLDAFEGRWLLESDGVPTVPALVFEAGPCGWGVTSALGFCAPYDFDALKALAEGPTLVEGARAGTIREGVVVKPLAERWERKVGRVQLKIVSADFLARF